MLTKAQILRLQVRARRRHNLTEEEFYKLTPTEYLLYEEDLAQEMEEQDRRFGRVCALLANVHRDSKKRNAPYTEEDFIPQRKPDDVGKQMRKLADKFGFKKVSD